MEDGSFPAEARGTRRSHRCGGRPSWPGMGAFSIWNPVSLRSSPRVGDADPCLPGKDLSLSVFEQDGGGRLTSGSSLSTVLLCLST